MRALVIGLGIGAKHAHCYRAAGFDVVTCDRDGSSLEGAESVDDWRQALRDVDVVSVCSYDADHFEQVSEAIALDKWVMVEKPPCLHMDEAQYLMQNDKKLSCNLPLPYHFADIIAAHKDNKPTLIECDYLWGRRNKLVDGWRDKNYSIILGAGLHMFHLMMHFHDEMPVDGAALGGNTTNVSQKFDCVQGITRWEDGTLGRVSINCSFNGQHQHRLAITTPEDHACYLNTEEVDKTPPIQNFIDHVLKNEEFDNTKLWRAMDLCFQLEQVA